MQIDWWTLALQTLNVLILVWILGRFFFRPVAAIVAKRQEEANRLLKEAETARQQAAAAHGEAEKERADLAARRDHLIEEAHRAAKAEQAGLLAQSLHEVARMRDEAAAASVRDRAAAEDAVLDHAGELSIDIARRLLARLAPAVAFRAFVEGLCDKARSLAEGAREGLKPAPESNERVEVLTSAPLSDEEQRQLSAELAKALGFALPLAFRRDPTLLAGLEVHGRTTVLRNSWRADLATIREEIGRERNVQSA
jgi:F-type H+-transporting ATPase subunit b